MKRQEQQPDLEIVELARFKPGRIFYSGRLYVIEATGSSSKARPWGTPPGTRHGCVTLSPKSVLAQFYPVIERAMVLPPLKRSDFLIDGRPTAYSFESEKDAQRAAQLDSDLAANTGLDLQKMSRLAAWLLTDGAKPYRLYHYAGSSAADAACAVYCAKNNFVECSWPDARTRHWLFLFEQPC